MLIALLPRLHVEVVRMSPLIAAVPRREQKALSNALRLEVYIKDAERAGDNELAEFFRKAQADSRKGADQGKQLLAARLGA